MLTRLTGSQVTEYWKVIEDSLTQSLAYEVSSSMAARNKILRTILVGKLVCWILHYPEKTNTVKAVVLTTIVEEDLIDSKSLMIFSLGILEKPSADEWTEGFDSLAKYGKGVGCYRLLFYTRNAKMLKIAKLFGSVQAYTMVTIDI